MPAHAKGTKEFQTTLPVNIAKKARHPWTLANRMVVSANVHAPRNSHGEDWMMNVPESALLGGATGTPTRGQTRHAPDANAQKRSARRRRQVVALSDTMEIVLLGDPSSLV